MALTKKAKILTPEQILQVYDYLERRSRCPLRDKLIFQLFVLAGLRVKEISHLTWEMVTDSDGRLADSIHLPNMASKGRRGGRIIPIHPDLFDTLQALRDRYPTANGRIILTQQGKPIAANFLAHWFKGLYAKLGFNGCSSHSGRRTFITRLAINAVTAGCSLVDVQEVAGHANLTTTQGYIQSNANNQRKLVAIALPTINS